jgi:hypothetical protein
MQKYSVTSNLSVYPVTQGPKHHFFGYYDKCPWDRNEQLLLTMEVDFIDHLPESHEPAIIGIVNLENHVLDAFAETRAWNFQQGSMLQWLPPHFKDWIIYNDFENDGFISCIVNIKDKQKIVLPKPIYTVHPSGEYALTTNFARLHEVRRGYGYSGCEDQVSGNAPATDGIYLINLKNKECRLIFSLAQLAHYDHIDSMDYGKHSFEHLTFNPSGSRFCFLHRWLTPNKGFATRPFTANLDGTGLHCLLDSGCFSHFGWRNSEELLGWGRMPNKLNQMARSRWFAQNVLKFILPLYHSISSKNPIKKKIANDHYLLFRDQTSEINQVGAGDLEEDGHCSWSPNGQWILTDTYPDRSNMRTLILYNYREQLRFDLGKFYSFPDKSCYTDKDWNSSGMRCDLHPRWDHEGMKVCFDSVHEGSRQMYVVDLTQLMRGFS